MKNIKYPEERRVDHFNYLLSRLSREQRENAELVGYCRFHQCGLYWDETTKRFYIG